MDGPTPHYERIYKFAESRVKRSLKNKLPDGLFYHRPGHTFSVVKAVEHIGEAARRNGELTGREYWLLKLAALYHDFGFTHQIKENEPFGAHEATQELGRLGLHADDLALIGGAILDTALVPHPDVSLDTYHQTPQSKLGRYLCDADLSTLGRKDFFKTNEWYRQEHNYPLPIGERLSEAENLRRVHRFLMGHQWHTAEAREFFGEGKRRNLTEVRRQLTALDATG